jgi:CheY-like chemotaxis protein
VKFTEDGEVALRIWMEHGLVTGVGGSSRIVFSVVDTGVGISDENLKRIFGAFQQGDGTTSRRHGGTGLGLSISREVATLLGGDIRVESVFGEGSTFTLFLPLTTREETREATRDGSYDDAPDDPAESLTATPPIPPDAVEPLPVAELSAHPGLNGKKILVVDDDVRNVFAISSILELYGLAVLHAPNGREGIATLLANDDVDLILMDVMMPEMDGYATMSAIREMPRFLDIPIIAVTAKAMRRDREKCLAAGASDFVTKPVDTERLLTCIEQRIER